LLLHCNLAYLDDCAAALFPLSDSWVASPGAAGRAEQGLERWHPFKSTGVDAWLLAQNAPMRSLLLVDDHPLYRDGMRRALEEALPALQVHLAADATAALAVLEASPDLDLCISDYRLPHCNGLQLLEQVGQSFPLVARALLGSVLTPELAQRAQTVGCVACLSKDRDAQAMTAALQVLFDGGTLFDVQPAAGADAGTGGLSERRMQVLRLAAAGFTNRDIALQMSVSERTIKDHWTYIFEQLQVANRVEAVTRAIQSQLL
jgi:DNA-binding NarL/FixJ family response regulator